MRVWTVAAVLYALAWSSAVCPAPGFAEQPKTRPPAGREQQEEKRQGPQGQPPSSDNAATNRVALVIGNSKYGGELALANPANDADAVATALKDLNFTVIRKTDVNLEQMEDALVDFRRKLPKGGLGLFYYAGHGVQVEGNNYLVPIGAKLREEFEVKRQCLEVNQVMEAMGESDSNLKVLILDCCRNNPFKRSWKRSLGEHGLKAIDNVPEGTIVAFSTAAGKTADDGEGKNSPYAEQLVSVLRSRPAEGLELKEVFFESSRKVKHVTGQTPWINMEASLDKYYLRLPNETGPASNAVSSTPDVKVATSLEGTWNSVGEEVNGQAWDAKLVQDGKRQITIRGDSLTMSREYKGKPGTYSGTFRVDAAVRSFDFDGNGPDGNKVQFRGIYELSGDTLKLCYRYVKNNSTSRPTTFRTDDGNGATSVMLTLKQEPQKAPPADAVVFNGHSYKFFSEVLSWHQAKARCIELGGHLPVIESEAENAFVTELARKSLVPLGEMDATWLGGTDEHQEDDWKWVNGQKIDFTRWYPGQPNNKENAEHYMILWIPKGEWADQPKQSANHKTYFVCEWDSIPKAGQ